MAARFCPGVVPADAGSSLSVTNELSATPKAPSPASREFPKTSRILKPSVFRKVYDQGTRMTCPFFAAFHLPDPALDGPLFGFTTPRALGKAVFRNRLRRRLREAVRIERHRFAPHSMLVFNPRRAMADVPLESLRKEVARVADRCAH